MAVNGGPPAPQYMGSTNTVFLTETRFDSSYLRTLGGIMKVVVISSVFRWHGPGAYFNIVALIGLLFSGTFLMFYLFHIVEKHHNVKWLMIEMIANIVILFLYLIASTVAVAYGAPAFSAAGFFGYLSMVVYGADAYLKARSLKAGELPQGHRVVAKQAPAAPQPLP